MDEKEKRKKKEVIFENEIDEIRDKVSKLERDELLNHPAFPIIHEQLTSLWYDLPRILYYAKQTKLKEVI